MTDLPVDIKADFTPAIDASVKGISKIFNLFLPRKFQTKILEQARRERLFNAQAEQDANLIEMGLARYHDDDEMILSDSRLLPNPLSLAMQIDEEQNLSKSLKMACELCRGRSDTPSEEDVSKTFINKWRENAKLISEDSLSSLWAQLLTAEVYKPNSIDFKTLEVVSVLSKSDAMLFADVCKSVVFEGAIPFGKKQTQSAYFNDINERDLMDLSSMGLVKNFESNFRTASKMEKTNYQGSPCGFFVYGDFCILFDFVDDAMFESISFPFRELTKQGRQLYKALAKPMVSDIENFCKYLMGLEEFQNKVKMIKAFKYMDKGSNTLENDCLFSYEAL